MCLTVCRVASDGLVEVTERVGGMAFVDVEGAKVVLNVGIGWNASLCEFKPLASFGNFVFMFEAGANCVLDFGFLD